KLQPVGARMVSPILKLGLYIDAVSDLAEFQDAKDGMRTFKSRRRRLTRLASHFDLADLHGWLRVGIVRDVAHDCLRMRAKSLLECIDRIECEMNHCEIGRRGTGCTTSYPFLDGHVFACGAELLFHHRNVLC